MDTIPTNIKQDGPGMPQHRREWEGDLEYEDDQPRKSHKTLFEIMHNK